MVEGVKIIGKYLEGNKGVFQVSLNPPGGSYCSQNFDGSILGVWRLPERERRGGRRLTRRCEGSVDREEKGLETG